MARRPRRTRRRLPRYAYRPGCNPHPRRHPGGHSRGRPEPPPRRFDPAAWAEDEDYLHAIELFHAGYWWESHERFEALWHGFGRRTPEGRLLRALVLAAGAELKRAVGQQAGAERLVARAREALEPLTGTVLGVEVRALGRALAEGREPLRIPLGGPTAWSPEESAPPAPLSD